MYVSDVEYIILEREGFGVSYTAPETGFCNFAFFTLEFHKRSTAVSCPALKDEWACHTGGGVS